MSASVLVLIPATSAAAAGRAAVNRPAAAAAARRNLAAVQIPKDAVASASVPAGARQWLSRPPMVPLTPNLVAYHSFYVISGAPPKAIRWFRSHKPTGSRLTGWGNISDHGHVEEWELDFSWPGVRNVLFSEDVTVAAVVVPGGKTAIRFDSQVTYLPPKLKVDLAPNRSVAVHVLVAVPTAKGPGENLEPPILTTDAATIRKITNAVDAMQVLLPGVYPCPPPLDEDVYVEFTGRLGKKPGTIVTAYPYGCGFVHIEHGGRTSPQTLVDGGTLAQALQKLVGLKLPPVPPGATGG